jgi:prepilin-type N-terminal cleavage/methylation domain-containing protein
MVCSYGTAIAKSKRQVMTGPRSAAEILSRWAKGRIIKMLLLIKKGRDERGFTLIELLIIVAIIGILAAIAIPTFGAYRSRGFDSAAISDLKNASVAQEAYYIDHEIYCDDVVLLQAVPYNLDLSDGVSLNITNADNSGYAMTAVHASSGKVFSLTGPGGSIAP